MFANKLHYYSIVTIDRFLRFLSFTYLSFNLGLKFTCPLSKDDRENWTEKKRNKRHKSAALIFVENNNVARSMIGKKKKIEAQSVFSASHTVVLLQISSKKWFTFEEHYISLGARTRANSCDKLRARARAQKKNVTCLKRFSLQTFTLVILLQMFTSI